MTVSQGELVHAINELYAENRQLRLALSQQKASTKDNRPKLQPADVRHIKELVRLGFSRREVARAYDVNPSTVSRLVKGVYHR